PLLWVAMERRWSGRNEFSRAGLAVLKELPLQGLGPGNYSRDIRAYLNPRSKMHYLYDPRSWMHLHNLYMQLLVDYGMVGGFLIFGAIGLLLKKAWQGAGRHRLGPYALISVLAFFVHNVVDI